MASLDISEYSSNLEDMFPFPSSPDDQLAIFSPLSSSGEEDQEGELELGVYDQQKQFKGKMTQSQGNRAMRIQAGVTVPSLESKKQAPTLSLADICDPKSSPFSSLSGPYPMGLVPDIPRGVSAPLHVQPSSLSSSSRIKSTPPNLPLLFSLFSVLEDDEDHHHHQSSSPATSSPTSPISSSSAYSSSRRQSPASSPAPPRRSCSPVASSVTLEVVPTVMQWMNHPVSAGFPDRTSLLSNFADVLN